MWTLFRHGLGEIVWLVLVISGLSIVGVSVAVVLAQAQQTTSSTSHRYTD